ncbi:hypothetical protein [Leclercia sp. UBA5958]|uniref:hypothetical protein n=1 Tax=Leclercia sp. UBA5958 TaxID=1946742 RepID=UPI00257E3422|nr:hypothetical protein [Leclercia sp. UBA5958]
MKRYGLVLLIVLFISGCAPQNQNNNLQKQYADLANCEDNITMPKQMPQSKKEFAEFLSKAALNASADQFVTQKRIEILQLVGWDNSVADAITTCGVTRKSKLKEIGSNVFETMKASTKDTEERRALVEAYSSWEAYVTSQTPLAKQDFDSKVSYYKNM